VQLLDRSAVETSNVADPQQLEEEEEQVLICYQIFILLLHLRLLLLPTSLPSLSAVG